MKSAKWSVPHRTKGLGLRFASFARLCGYLNISSLCLLGLPPDAVVPDQRPPVYGAAGKEAKPKRTMKTNLKLNHLSLNDFRAGAQRISRAGLAFSLCLFGFLLPAQGQDPWLTNTNNPMDTNVSVGASVRFQVYATTAYPPVTYQWQHEGTNLPGAVGSILNIANVMVTNAGGYVAWITNAIGDFTNSRTATLAVDPTFTQVMAAGALLTDAVGAWNAAWIDIDGDGYLDVSVAPGGNRTVATPLYHNEGDGTFRKITTNAIGTTAVRAYTHVWGDYNNDGMQDLFVPNTGTMNDMLFHNNGSISFTRIGTGHPVIDGDDSGCGAWVDYDRDGFLDIFVSTYGGCPGQNDLLYRNNGDGTFRKMTLPEVGPIVGDSAPTDYVTWADVDNDGWPELSRTLGNWCNSLDIWTNQLLHLDSQGKFYLMDIGEMKKGTGGFTIATWADYDNDGFLDAVVSVGNGLTGFYHNLAGQGFTNISAVTFPTPITNGYPWYVGDYDNDGWLDLVVLASDVALYRNNGDGTFAKQDVGGPTSAGGWPIWGDYDNDGFLDVFMGFTPNSRNLLFRHNGNTNHWLKVKLDGRASNRSGIGAKVRVNTTIGGRNFWQMREISGQGIGLDNGLLAHFGLGDATNVTTLRIEWPSGIVQELHDVTNNQFLTVVESQGYTDTNAIPKFTAAARVAGRTELSFTEPAAPARYILEASTDLVNWTKLMARTSTGVTTNYTDTGATNYTQRFYRLQVP